MIMPVLRNKGESSELVLLDLNDVLYINIEDRNIVYHTAEEKFYQISKLSELDEHLMSCGFDLLDKTNLVNMNKIKFFDPKYGKIFFEEHPTKYSKYASVAAIQQKVRKHQIERAIATNTNASMEYSLKDAGNKVKLSARINEAET